MLTLARIYLCVFFINVIYEFKYKYECEYKYESGLLAAILSVSFFYNIDHPIAYVTC